MHTENPGHETDHQELGPGDGENFSAKEEFFFPPDKSTRDQENGHPETKGPSESVFCTFCGFRGKNSSHVSFRVVTTPS